eukprot:7284814-Prymnesium_polylepis.1
MLSMRRVEPSLTATAAIVPGAPPAAGSCSTSSPSAQLGRETYSGEKAASPRSTPIAASRSWGARRSPAVWSACRARKAW